MRFYRIVRPWVTGIPRLLWRVRVVGLEHIPTSGGYILAPSHRSMMDIPFAAIVTNRRIRFMGKSSLFGMPVLGTLFRRLGGIPVERDGTDRKAVRESVAMLAAGEVLCVYPEGTRQHGPKIQPLQPGAAYFALRSGAPIIPIGIAGAEEILRTRSDPIPRLGRVTIVVGAPLLPEVRTTGVVPRERVDALTATLSDALHGVLDYAYERRDRNRHHPRAGRPD
jgi:1-acyl-sn-glycerol-3-phosphate acyltransferase